MLSVRKPSLAAILAAVASLPILARAEALTLAKAGAMAEASVGGQKFTCAPLTAKKK